MYFVTKTHYWKYAIPPTSSCKFHSLAVRCWWRGYHPRIEAESRDAHTAKMVVLNGFSLYIELGSCQDMPILNVSESSRRVMKDAWTVDFRLNAVFLDYRSIDITFAWDSSRKDWLSTCASAIRHKYLFVLVNGQFVIQVGLLCLHQRRRSAIHCFDKIALTAESVTRSALFYLCLSKSVVLNRRSTDTKCKFYTYP